MRFRPPELFLGCFLTVAVFAMGALFSSQYPSRTTQEQHASKGAYEQGQRQKDEGLWNWIIHDAAGFFTLWLVVVGGGQLTLFYVQLKLIRESLAPAKEAADAAKDAASAAKLNAQAVIDGQRAHLYVTVVQHDVSETIQAGNQARHYPSIEKTKMHAPVLAYVFSNAGKTPAILEEIMHSMMVEKTEAHTISYEAPERALEILEEGQSSDRIAVTFDERPFLLEDAKALGDHDLMLFFYSAATYRDIYNRQHKIRHDFLYSAGRFHLVNRIEKTTEPDEQGGAESEQTSRTGFFSRPL